MIDSNTSLENAIWELEDKDKAGTLSADWRKVLMWLSELADYKRQAERIREFAEDERWD